MLDDALKVVVAVLQRWEREGLLRHRTEAYVINASVSTQYAAYVRN
jgi:hypothetical protein